MFLLPIVGIHFWLLWNAILFITIYLKRLVLPLKTAKVSKEKYKMKIMLVYQSQSDLVHLQKQYDFLEQLFGNYEIKTLPIWKSLDLTFNFNRNKNAGLFWNLFYTEIYLIYFKYLKVLLPDFLREMTSKNGLILCTIHEQFYKNDKINIVGFSRGFPFSHVILSKTSAEHVLAHEIGHTCGLWHQKDEHNLMYPLTPKLPAKISELQYKAILKARYIY